MKGATYILLKIIFFDEIGMVSYVRIPDHTVTKLTSSFHMKIGQPKYSLYRDEWGTYSIKIFSQIHPFLSNPLLFASEEFDLIKLPVNFVKYFYISAKNQKKSNNLLNCSPKRQKAVDLKGPVKLWENFDGISFSFNSVKRVLWPYNKVKQRNIFGHSVQTIYRPMPKTLIKAFKWDIIQVCILCGCEAAKFQAWNKQKIWPFIK